MDFVAGVAGLVAGLNDLGQGAADVGEVHAEVDVGAGTGDELQARVCEVDELHVG